jgi:hypothetical protein
VPVKRRALLDSGVTLNECSHKRWLFINHPMPAVSDRLDGHIFAAMFPKGFGDHHIGRRCRPIAASKHDRNAERAACSRVERLAARIGAAIELESRAQPLDAGVRPRIMRHVFVGDGLAA